MDIRSRIDTSTLPALGAAWMLATFLFAMLSNLGTLLLLFAAAAAWTPYRGGARPFRKESVRLPLTAGPSLLAAHAWVDVPPALLAASVYFLIVLPVNRLMARLNRGEAPPDPTTTKCPECLSEVAIAARRCAFCTSSIA